MEIMVKKLACVMLSIGLVACGGEVEEAGSPTTERTTAVTVTKPEIREINSVLRALGTVESIQNPTIAAETSGRVETLTVTDGDTVLAGQLLVSIDSTLHQIAIAKANAELKRQAAMVENQTREVTRLKQLAKTQAVSQNQLEDEESQLTVMEGQRDVARKQLEQAKYLEDKTRVLSPMDGAVTKRYVSRGDYVSVGQPLFDLVAVDPLQARLAFPEHSAAQVTLGKSVVLTSPVAPTVRAEGKVTGVNPLIGNGNRAVEVLVEFSNPGGWLPGSSVDAVLVIEARPDAMTLPKFSVSNRNGHTVVFVVKGDKARTRNVELGWSEGDWVEVKSGIDADDLVVVEGAGLISEGSKVKVSAKAPKS